MAEKTESTRNLPQVRWHRSIYFKLAVSLLFCLLIGALIQLYISSWAWRALADEVEQKAQWQLADDLAAEFEQEFRAGFNLDSAERLLFRYLQLLPKVDLFIVDSRGKILAHNVQGRQLHKLTVDLKPVQIALSNEYPSLPLYLAHPYYPEKYSVFSAARLQLGENQGYLIAILGSRTLDYLVQFTGQFYLVRMYGYSFATSLLLSLVFVSGLLWFFTKRLRQLTKVIGEIEHGDFSARTAIPSDDELGLLADAVNKMAHTIQANTEELARRDTFRRQMIATITHDLRNPMESLRTSLSRMQQSPRSLPLEDFCKLAERSLDSQMALTEDLLQLAFLEVRTQKAEIDAFSLDELATYLCQQVAAQVEAKGQSLDYMPAQIGTYVLGDQRMSYRVVYNLLQNAIRHSPDGSRLEVETGVDGERGYFRVTNYQVNFDPGLLTAVAKEKSTALSQSAREGLGLGLLIVRELLQLQGAQLECSPVPPDGICFSFHLPLARL